MHEKILQHSKIGKIQIVKNPRARNISISVRPFSGVRVSIPNYISYASAIRFVEHKEDWIIKNLEKVSGIVSQRITFTESTIFSLKSHMLEIRAHEKENIDTIIHNNKISVLYPKTVDVKSEKVQEIIRSTILKAMKKEAHAYLPYRVKFWAEKYTLQFNDIRLKNTKTRWGSCSFSNNINLNIQLMRLPDYLIDYVILHELAHTIQKNHSPKFWGLLDKLTDGNAKKYSSDMKKFHTQIF